MEYLRETPPPIIVSLADDLTGANVTAALLKDAGVESVNVISITRLKEAFNIINASDAIVINVGSRDTTEHEATSRCYQVIKFIQQRLHHKRILWNKRLDTTLRGFISAELKIFQIELTPSHYLVAPAYPSAGRTTLNGIQQLAKNNYTTIERDSLMIESHLQILGVPICKFSVNDLRQNSGDLSRCLLNKSNNALIFDVRHEDDFVSLAKKTVSSWYNGALVVDSGPYLSSLVQVANNGVINLNNSVHKKSIIMIIVGSRENITRRQIDLVAESFENLLVVSPQLLKINQEDLDKAEIMILKSDLDYIDIDDELQSIAETLSKILEHDQVRPSSILISGGMTADFILSYFNAMNLKIVGELMPLVPFGIIEGGEFHKCVLVTKGGLVGDDQTAVEIIRQLRLIQKYRDNAL